VARLQKDSPGAHESIERGNSIWPGLYRFELAEWQRQLATLQHAESKLTDARATLPSHRYLRPARRSGRTELDHLTTADVVAQV
jgi:hypothetical protein